MREYNKWRKESFVYDFNLFFKYMHIKSTLHVASIVYFCLNADFILICMTFSSLSFKIERSWSERCSKDKSQSNCFLKLSKNGQNASWNLTSSSSSSVREVTPLSSIPHGTMCLYQSRSVLQFRDIPWVVIKRLPWIPWGY